jgi:hypothetical protein
MNARLERIKDLQNELAWIVDHWENGRQDEMYCRERVAVIGKFMMSAVELTDAEIRERRGM